MDHPQIAASFHRYEHSSCCFGYFFFFGVVLARQFRLSFLVGQPTTSGIDSGDHKEILR
jgi:hypothetical protein